MLRFGDENRRTEEVSLHLIAALAGSKLGCTFGLYTFHAAHETESFCQLNSSLQNAAFVQSRLQTFIELHFVEGQVFQKRQRRIPSDLP